MSQAYDDLVNWAEASVNIALKHYNHGAWEAAFYPLLIGEGAWCLESHSAHDAGHNWQAVLDALHNRYKETQNFEIIAGFCGGLDYLIKNKEMSWFEDYMWGQLDMEKRGEAQFTIDESYKDKLSPVYQEKMKKWGLM